MIRVAIASLALTASVTIALAQTAVPMRLYVFDGGILESDPGRYRLTKEDVGETRLSVACYLIAHPRGVLMWDTCAVPDAEWTPTGQPVATRLVLGDGAERRVTIQSALAAQLKAVGHPATDVTMLALSHHHWDHTANANAFAGATWLVPPAEREAMFADKPAGTVRPATYAGLRTSKSVSVTAAEHDVFGDGTVIIKSAPGHTAGHQVLYVKLPKTGGVLLSGDLYHYPQERTLHRPPPDTEANVQQSAASRVMIEEYLKKTKTEIWISHDFVANAKLKKSQPTVQ